MLVVGVSCRTFDMSGDWRPQAGRRPLDGMVCAQHGRELMGWMSPVGVPTWTRHESKDNHEPTARACPRGFVWRKPECKRCKARTETAYKAEGCEASWHMTAKPTGTQPAVNAALMGEGVVQKSAAAMVVFRYFTIVADHEGPNMRSRMHCADRRRHAQRLRREALPGAGNDWRKLAHAGVHTARRRGTCDQPAQS